MSVLKQKRTTSKAEFINTANQIYVETINFLTRLSARYSRLIAEPIAKLAGEIIDLSLIHISQRGTPLMVSMATPGTQRGTPPP